MTLSTSLIAAFLLFAVGMAAPAPFTVGDFSPATGETDLPASLRSSFLIESKHDIQASSRQFAQASCSDSGPCKMDDPQCMSSLALKYTNDFRATQGVGPLKQGTVNQFNNAQKYSGVLRRLGDLEHQELSSVQIGCGSRLSGENIAQNHCDDDPARRCVDAWIGSPPHRRNMLSTYHETMSVGIVFGPRTQIWCTQTFAVQTTFGTTGGCAPIDADNAPASPIPTTSPIATPSVGPNNMMSTATIETTPSAEDFAADDDSEDDDSANPCADFVKPEFTIRGVTFTARSMNGKCKYCATSFCASAQQSSRANAFFKSRSQ